MNGLFWWWRSGGGGVSLAGFGLHLFEDGFFRGFLEVAGLFKFGVGFGGIA